MKLYRFVPLFRNSILLKSSFNEKLIWFKIELCPIYGMRNLCSRGKELTEKVNDESVWLTRSSRSLDIRPLRAFIITSICSFIAYISAATGGGVTSVRDGRLTFCRSGLLGALLLSGPSRSRRSTLASWSSS